MLHKHSAMRAPARRVARNLALHIAAAALAVSAATSAHAQERQGDGFDYSTWQSYLGGSESAQYSSLDQINKQNVNELELAWSFPAGADAFGMTFGPIVVDGTMYVLADGNSLVALDAVSGQEKWRTAFEGRIGSRGVNFWKSADGNDRRLLVINDGFLRAVSADTGEILKDFGTNGGVDLRIGLNGDVSKVRALQTNNPGRVFENLIIISLPAGAYDYESSPGDIHAYDIRSGELVWTFHVVPKAGEFGADTWPDNAREGFGGVHNWSESTVDEELGIVYIPTGTARYDFYGGNRPGDNLFANSILALNARTGERIWHFQTIRHDLWDMDLPIAPKLMDIERDGQKVPILIQPTKTGHVFVFDRRNGEPIWEIEDMPVPESDVPGEWTSPTQPIPSWPPAFGRYRFTEDDINPYLAEEDKAKLRELIRSRRNEGIYTPPSIDGTIAFPGHNGGVNWGMATVDPVNKRFYVVARHIPTMIRLIPDRRPEAIEAMPNAGGDVIPYRSPVDFMLQPNGMVAVSPPWSTITAYDMNSGNILWQVPNGDVKPLADKGITGTGAQTPRGGPASTASGLIFIGTASDRKFRARDAATGQVLWEYDLPAATEGVPAIYEAGGRQYVTIPVGGAGHFTGGLGLPEPGPNRYMTFALPERANGER